MPELVPGDGLLTSLATEAEDLFNEDAPLTRKEEDGVLKKIIDEYEVENIRDTMDEQGKVPESIYFFYGGDSDQFNNALEFLGLSPINREFGAFLMSDLGLKTMTQNKLSIHVDSGDIFYDNHNTGQNLYSFLLSQQNDEAAYVPKKMSYSNSFEEYISKFLQQFSIDDQEKFDLWSFKNSKYLFYRFNDFIKAYGNPRYKLLHTKKKLDTVGVKNIEEKNKEFLIEKLIHSVEFEDLYATNPEKNSEILQTMERNYRILRRVYQQLHIDITELFSEFINYLSSHEIKDMSDDIEANGWGIKKITEVEDNYELFKIFQDFYTITGRLPLSNSLLVVPDGDAPPDEKVNTRQLYDLYKNTKSHGIVSLPFLGLIQYYLEENDQSLIKNATSELYYDLGYSTLSGARDFNFDAVSDLTARLSILLKHTILGNKKMREIEKEVLAQKINGGWVFEPKIEDPLGDVVKIIDMPYVDHKKTMHPYVEPTVQTADEIDKNQEIIDTDFIDLKTLYDKPWDVATETKKEKKIETLIDDVLNEKNPFNTFDGFWWEEDIFSKQDSPKTTELSKDILDKINEMSDNILRNIRPVDNRTEQEKIDNQFIPIDNRTRQELEDDDYLSFESDIEVDKKRWEWHRNRKYWYN